MALMSTIPCGSFAVSIPGDIDPGCGCPILTTVPPAAGGFVVMYGRKPNGRYEAAGVQYQATGFAFEEFVPFARRWVEENVGTLKAIPGRYGYFAPARDEWGVILRDNGYVARDPSGMPSTVTRELRVSRQAHDSSGILARIAVFAGDKQRCEEALPVFARVEVALADSAPGSDWISFTEYQSVRAGRTRPPEAILPGFHDWLRRFTEECGFKYWVFRPGMLFGDRKEWWGDGVPAPY